jgi:ribose 5-phosphate isomerase A
MATINPADIDTAKKAAGKAAADLVQSGMVVGLGTGSTASYFIDALIERIKNQKLHISAVATSEQSAVRAVQGGIPLRDINQITKIDLTVDGADAIDPKKRMIKGGGGAHLREKIVAAMSDQMVIIVDPSKEVEQFGGVPLPVEILPFAYRSTIQHIEAEGFKGKLRHNQNGAIYVTDNGNYIFDIALDNNMKDLEAVDLLLHLIPGVLATGFFLGLATLVIVGYPDGHTETRM